MPDDLLMFSRLCGVQFVVNESKSRTDVHYLRHGKWVWLVNSWTVLRSAQLYMDIEQMVENPSSAHMMHLEQWYNHGCPLPND